VIVCLAILAFTAASRAELVTLTLNEVTLTDGGNMTGSITFNNGNQIPTNWSIKVTAGQPIVDSGGSIVLNPFTFTSSNSNGAMLEDQREYPIIYGNITFGSVVWNQSTTLRTHYTMGFYFPCPDFPVLPTEGTVPMVFPSNSVSGYTVKIFELYEYPNGSQVWAETLSESRRITSGSLIATPLPPSALLLGSGLLGLALARFRKRRGK